jgi:hypothetical protein
LKVEKLCGRLGNGFSNVIFFRRLRTLARLKVNAT